MSSLLDALQKSDNERKQGDGLEFPSIYSELPIHGASPRKKLTNKNLLYLLPALLLLFAGMTSYFRSQVAHPDPPPVTHNQNAEKTLKKETAINKTFEKRIAPPATATATIRDINSGPITLKKRVSLPALIPPKTHIGTVIEPLPITESGDPIPLIPPSPFTPPEPDAEIVYFRELPDHIKVKIPRLEFAGHTYAEIPQQRLIMINNRIYHEGERLDSNLTLKEITWQGIVLEFSGMIFQVTTH